MPRYPAAIQTSNTPPVEDTLYFHMDFYMYIHCMRHITFYGWQVGMQQEAFTQLLRTEAELGLKEAHASMLRVLEEQPVTLNVPDELAVRLLSEAKALGVRCRLEPPIS
jgi:hypothetical protein